MDALECPAADEILRESVRLKYQQHFELALQTASTCVEQFPTYYNAYFQRALVAQECRKYDLSQQDFEHAIELLQQRQPATPRVLCLLEILRGWLIILHHGRGREELRIGSSEIEDFKHRMFEENDDKEFVKQMIEMALRDDEQQQQQQAQTQVSEEQQLIETVMDLSLTDQTFEELLQAASSTGEREPGVPSAAQQQQQRSQQKKSTQSEEKYKQKIEACARHLRSLMDRQQQVDKKCKDLHAEAQACFQRAIELDGSASYAHFSLGYILESAKEYKSSIKAFLASLERGDIGDRKCSAHNNVAWCYQELQNDEKALEYFNKAIEEYDSFVRAYYNRARFYRDAGKWQLALEDCDRVIGINPLHAYAYLEKADVYLYDLDEKENGLKCLNLAKKYLEGQEAYPFMAIAMQHVLEGNTAAAVAEIDSGIRQCTDISGLRRLFMKRARYHKMLGNKQQAVNDLAELHFVEPHRSRVFKGIVYDTFKRKAFTDCTIDFVE